MSRIGPDAGTLDLLAQQVRAQPERLAALEVLVLVRRQLPVMEAEAAPQSHAHPVGGGGPVERPGDRRPPVDDDRIPIVVADVAAADVERLDAVVHRAFRVPVGAPEERRRVRVGAQGAQPFAAQPAEGLAGQLVHAVVGDRRGAALHARQTPAGGFEMGAFGEQVRIIGHGSSTLPVGRNLINDLAAKDGTPCVAGCTSRRSAWCTTR